MKPLGLKYIPEHMRPWVIWAIATFFAFYQFFLQNITTLMAEAWMQSYHISLLAVSNLSASFYYAYVALQIPVGLLLDRYGARRTLSIAATFLTVGCIGTAITDHYTIAFICRFLMGTGASFSFVGLLCLSATWFSRRQFALAVGLAEMTALIGAALGDMLTARVMPLIGWRHVLLIGGMVASILIILVLLFIQNQPDEAKPLEHHERKSILFLLKNVLSNPIVWYAGFYGFSLFSMVNVFSSLWGVPFLKTIYHVNLQLATSMTAMVLFGYAMGGALNGWFSSNLNSYKPIMLTGAGSTLVLLSILIFSPAMSHVGLYLLLLLIGLSASSYIQVFAIVRDSIDKDAVGTALATTNMLLMMSGPVLQTSIGALLESNIFGLSHNFQWTFRVSLSLLLVFILVAFALTCLVKEKPKQSMV